MSELPHILIVDDRQEVAENISIFLENNSYKATVLINANRTMNFLKDNDVSLILMDKIMPTINGLSLSQEIKAQYKIPIIMLTGVDDDNDRIIALETAVDDYITKPFYLRTLLAHIKALLRRKHNNNSIARYYHFLGWKINTVTHVLTAPNHTEIPLNLMQYELLMLLVTKPNVAHSREYLLSSLKGSCRSIDERRIDSLVSQLRQIFRKHAPDNNFIQTIRIRGYLFNCSVRVIH